MSYFDDASLVMIPSGYKTSKVYSVKPTDGTGDLAFTRSNDTATRVASNGLIEKVRTNLYPYGSALLTTGWTTQGATLTAGQTDPNGGTGALRVQLAAGASNYIYYAAATTANLSMTRSVYIKGASAQSLRFEDPSGVGGVTINVTTSWQRYTLALPSSGGGTYGIYFDNTPDAAAKDFTIAFVQIETGDIATDYIATTTAAVSVGLVANVPRLDYLNSSCPRLLLEPQRTNLLTYSEQANLYSQIGATIGSNVVTSPDGYTNADSIIEDASNGSHVFFSFGATTFTAAAYTASVFAKKGSRDWCALQIYDGTQGFTAFFNLNTGVVGAIAGAATSTITNYGNGWYRCTITATTLAGSTGGIAIYSANADSTNSYAGTNGLTAGYFYGWQLEVGAYATSYIPTLGAAVTRGNELASKSSINALIGGTSGTIFFEIKTNKTLTSANYKQFFYYTDASSVQAYMYLNGSNTLVLNPSLGNISSSINLAADTTYKVAVAYATNDFKLYINGVERGSSTSGTPINAVNLLSLGSYQGTSEFNEFVFSQYIHFPTRLSNADLAALTA